MEISLLVRVLGSAAMVYCGAIFLLSAGLFFIDRKPARAESLRVLRSTERSNERHEEDREDRHVA